ncbi:MAG: glycosyl hydrolase family 8 [Candidatus Levyibacteriota bacterium]
MKNIFGYFLIFISVVLLAYAVYTTTQVTKKNQTFSSYTFLTSSWEKYRDQFINKDGRVIDYSQGGITTSEAQSYAMLRAVFIGDKTTFDSVWNWTKNDMKRPHDNLFGWRWGKTTKGGYGFETQNDMNSAADADSDIALALILAAHRWNVPGYLDSAKQILKDFWTIEVGQANGKNYVIAGNWAKVNGNLIINPSYFSPYAYRIFAAVDKKHDWNSLISPGYGLLNHASQNILDKQTSTGLPPDWIAVASSSGQMAATNIPNLTTNYGYEAVRIPWRVALDYQWNSSPDAINYLRNSFTYLTNLYKQNSKLGAIYSHDGSELNGTESPTMYATSLAYLMVENPALAKKMYQEKILTLYSNDTNSFNSQLPYYEQNWLWLGAALYNKALKQI